MKIRYIYLSAIASLLTLGSCSDALDVAPNGAIDPNSVWENNDMVGGYLNTCYGYVRSKGICDYHFTTNVPIAMTDDVWDADAEVETGLGSANAYNGVATAGSHPLNVSQHSWGSLWEGVRMCNTFIEHLPTAKVTSEDNRAKWGAEAHFLRAYYYSELLHYYGSMAPIITKGTLYSDDFTQFAKKSSYREIVDFILADCDTVLMSPDIPFRPTSGADAGRATKALTYALRSRYSLFAASPLNATGQPDAMTWVEAYNINREALDAFRTNNYELYRESKEPATYNVFGTRGQVKWAKGAAAAAAYHEYFCMTSDISSNPRDKETIKEFGGRPDIWNLCGIGFQGYYKTGLCPTQELVDQYENVKYNSDVALSSYPIVDLALPYRDITHLKPNYNPENQVYNLEKPYEDRDPRFYATVVYNDCIRTAFWKNEEIDGRSGVRYAGNAIRTKYIRTNKEDAYTGIHGTARQRTRTGYYTNKYLKTDAGATNGDGAGSKLFRLAEIILNTAECAIKAGSVQEGMKLINEIRDRAGMPAWPLNVTEDEAMLYLKHERRVEFAIEDVRFDDMRRWQRPDGDMLEYQWITAMEISWQGDDKEGRPIYTYTRKPVRKSPRRCYSNKWLWVPIPLSDQNRLEYISGHAWQNPGW